MPEIYEVKNFYLKVVFLYSMKIKEQTRKLDAGSSKHSFEVADKADVV
ncbi:Substrate-specific component BioY of biotin ECF transporter [Streptococcus mitis]|uniref:Substrate-specific component BioY of biotin ECF transporter n=1 Tax=Streptococcus mitis TaxID=28037 RepID=A0A150NHH6_STRMT|nr:Substrate-specific component BioY of biotin ECF transporter [Streptococcus mitis]